MNETMKAIMSRYSCRHFKEEMPPQDQLMEIAKAAVASPSGMNRQPWKVILLKDRKLISEMEEDAMNTLRSQEDQSIYERIMSRGGTIFYHCPCMMVVAIEPGTGLDCGILCENISLAATALGLGSLICGMAGIPFEGANAADYARRLGFPEGYQFGIAVLLGYPAEAKEPHEPDMTKVSVVE